jgi:hypothetical protein
MRPSSPSGTAAPVAESGHGQPVALPGEEGAGERRTHGVESHPAREHADQMYPQRPVVRKLPFVSGGPPSDDVALILTQDKLALVGDEAAVLQASCQDSLHKVLPCEVEQATLTIAGQAGTQPRSVTFVDDGTGGDAQARDGISSFRLWPARQGLSQTTGRLLIELSLRTGHEQGRGIFEVTYTPDSPARLTGQVREVIEDGSLSLYLGVVLKTAGRYVVAVRVDDQAGKPFAFLTYNEETAVGTKELRVRVHGKLVHDVRPAFPLSLRDATGFLLRPDVEPDRLNLASLGGLFHRTGTYSLSAFSDKEWDSEERRRHLEEFEKDRKQAEADLEKQP